MLKFDLIVLSSGSGMRVVWRAVRQGLKVALVENGPPGGTCLNDGCIPSKVMIYPADVIRRAQDAKKLGVEFPAGNVDLGRIMTRVWALIDDERRHMAEEIRAEKNLTWLMGTGEFVGDRTLKVDVDTITAPKIVIATGARPLVPPIEGLDQAGYLDNVSLMNIKSLPGSINIVGAGYIGCEFGHFFSALGSKVTLIGRHPRMLRREDPEISEIVTKAMSRDLTFLAGHDALSVERQNGRKVVRAKDRKTGRIVRLEADELMLATGRKSNADILKPEKTGVKTDRRGWISVDRYMETTRPGIYALGDATGRYMFKHNANREADVVEDNVLGGNRREMDEHAIPHAVYVHPPVGSVGMTEAKAREAGLDILVGRARYADSPKGYAMGEEDGLVKVVAEEGTNRILGCSVVGPEAQLIVQQVVFLMNTDRQDLTPVWRSEIIHPTLSEVLADALEHLEKPKLALAS